MKTTRRRFVKGMTTGASALTIFPAAAFAEDTRPKDQALEQTAAQKVLNLQAFKDPVVIESIELLKQGREYFVRVRSKDGAEGISVDNARADVLHPIFNQ